MAERDEATTHADLYQRHEQNSDNWDEAEAVTGRENDTPLRDVDKPAVPNTTLAERARANKQPATKAVDEDDTENKSVTSAATKSKAAKKK